MIGSEIQGRRTLFDLKKYDYIDIQVGDSTLEDCLVEKTSGKGVHILNIKKAIDEDHNPMIKIFVPNKSIRNVKHNSIKRLLYAVNSKNKLIKEALKHHLKK